MSSLACKVGIESRHIKPGRRRLFQTIGTQFSTTALPARLLPPSHSPSHLPRTNEWTLYSNDPLKTSQSNRSASEVGNPRHELADTPANRNHAPIGQQPRPTLPSSPHFTSSNPNRGSVIIALVFAHMARDFDLESPHGALTAANASHRIARWIARR